MILSKAKIFSVASFGSLVLCLFTDLPISQGQILLHIELGSAAHARSPVRPVLEFIGREIVKSGTNWALDRAFNPKSQRVSPLTRSANTYIGSSFVAPLRMSNGSTVYLHYFGSSNGVWHVWNPQTGWRAISVPTFVVYRTADVYANSLGNLFWLRPR